MLSYRHAFHAGNHGDVIKHLVLVNTLEYLLRKAAPVIYIDTHAGAGCYGLDKAEARKTGEAMQGIGALNLKALPESAETYRTLMQPYLKRRQYPGSPSLAADLLRSEDRLCFFELHPADHKTLDHLFQKDRRVRVEQNNGFDSLKALLPVKNKRAVVLTDPSYELKSDYNQVAESILQGYKRMAHGVFLVWYPVVQRKLVNRMITGLKKGGVRDLWQYELGVAADSEDYGMTASGILAINPPWVLAEQMRSLLPAIQQQLAPDTGFSRVEQLVAE